MNYIVLNGMKSTLIKGLLISELPPITKPLIRTKTEEIDGRDGDIVTKLGYAAYDKKMSIGLYGDFNIDDIIQFFDSAGTVVFSNEPDKVYRYQINNQIDFERLLRFKTAMVVFHVQPFKFSSVADKVALSVNKLIIPNQSKKVDDLTITCTNNNITIDGETEPKAIFWRDIAVDKIRLKANTPYMLKFDLSTVGDSKISVGVINAATGDILGGSYATMNESHTITYTPSQDEVYDTLHIEVFFGYDASVTFKASLQSNITIQSFEVINRGNVIAKPTITLLGTGVATLTVNNKTVSISNIEHEEDEEITLNVETMNAYTHDILRNRDITGDLRQLAFEIGRNTLSYTGNVDLIYVERGSRWI